MNAQRRINVLAITRRITLISVALISSNLGCKANLIENENCERVNYSLFTDRSGKTLYEDVRGHETLRNKDCSPEQIWAFVRHGIRNSHSESIADMKMYLGKLKKIILKAHTEGRGTLCAEDIAAIESWRFDDIMPFEQNQLTDSGRRQMFSLGESIRNQFPTLLNTTFNPVSHQFRYANNQRTIQSMRSFAHGMFGQNDQNFIARNVGQHDDISDYDCHVYKVAPMQNNYELDPETYKFVKTFKIFERITENLTHRTGVSDFDFNKTIISTIYDACTFESSKDTNISPWCRVFTLEALELMTRREDMLHYSLSSYGSKYRDKFACKQLNDLIATFTNTIENGSDGSILKVYFSHDLLLQNILTKLGCFRGTETTGDLTFRKITDWHISKMIPFGANFVAVLYRCNNRDDFEVQFYLNEKPIGCCLTDSKDACSWNELRNSLEDFVFNCTADFCEDDDEPPQLLKNISPILSSNLYLTCVLIVSFYYNLFSMVELV